MILISNDFIKVVLTGIAAFQHVILYLMVKFFERNVRESVTLWRFFFKMQIFLNIMLK